VGPFLVVENERLVLRRAEHEDAAGHLDVARMIGLVDRRIRRGAIERGELRACVSERLLDERQVLRVHALVQRHERIEVFLLFGRLPPLDPADRSLEDLRDVLHRLAPRGITMVPAQAIRDVERVVDGVGTGEETVGAVEVAQDPVLLKPADVADLPDGRFEEMTLLAEQLRVIDPLEKLQLDVARLAERSEQVESGRLRDVHGMDRLGSSCSYCTGCAARFESGQRRRDRLANDSQSVEDVESPGKGAV